MRIAHLILTLAIASLGLTNYLKADETKYNAEIKKIDEMVEKGVKFLLLQAQANGSIGSKDQPNPGVTGLIVAAIAGSTQKEKSAKEIDAALQFILKTKNPKDNSYGRENMAFSNYFTSVAIMALSATDKVKYKSEIEGTKNYLKNTQFSESNGKITEKDWQYGGFDYNDKGEADPDLNNTGFALMALDSAELAKDDPTWKRATSFLQRVHNSQEVSDLAKTITDRKVKVLNDGGAMYYPGNTKGKEIVNEDKSISYPSYGSMTYQLMQSYLFSGVPKDDKRVQETMRYITNNWTLETNPGLPEKQAKEGLFNYYRIMAEALKTLGDQKIETSTGKRIVWAKDLSEYLSKAQSADGSWKNENSSRWMEGDPNLVTAYTILALNACRENLSK